jgi:hypothetical protein
VATGLSLSVSMLTCLCGSVLISDRLQSLILFESAHQHRVFTVVCAIECRQRLPAICREPRNVGLPHVPKHFCERGHNAKRNANPLAMGALSARRRAKPRTGSLRLVTLAALLGRALGRQGRSYAGYAAVNSAVAGPR